jgi:hypothetical protein
MTEEYEYSENEYSGEDEEYTVKDSDEQQSEPEPMTFENWNVDTDPDDLEWETQTDYESAREYYYQSHPTEWNGVDKPTEDQFDTYEEFQEAKMRWVAQQQLGGMGAPVAQQPEMPEDEDAFFIEKHQTFQHIQKYAADQERYTASGDHAKAQHARMMKESLERDLESLERDHPTPLFQRAIDEVKGRYLADVELAVKDRERFDELKKELGDAKMYNDATQRLKAVNRMYADSEDLYFIRGDSRDYRHPDWHIEKISLPPDVKVQMLRQAELHEGVRGGKTLEDLLVEQGYLARLKVEYDEDTPLEKKDPQHMTQAEYEQWRESQGAKPKYHPII